MANEIFGSELNVDFSGILQQAEAFDEKLKDIDHTAKQLGNTLRNALGNIDLGGIKSLKDNIERLGESKISLKVVGTEELGKMSSALDAIISQVDVFSKKANKQTVAPKTTALFDLEELQAKRDRAVAIIKDLEGQVRALNTQYQAALTERGAVRDSIGGISKDEISELQQQINELGQAMQQVGAGSGQNWRQSIQPYIDAINQLKDKIAQIKEEEDSLIQTEGAKPNSRVAQLDAQYDGLYKTINGLLDEVDQIDSEMQDKIASNKAVEEQIKKIEEWKAKIKELEDDFTRLNAAGKAFGSDGKLTSEGADLTNRKAQLEEELKLMQMNATEAKRYSNSIIAQEQREADLAIQEEQRTTTAKIAEYERLMREERRLKADRKLASKADLQGLDNGSLERTEKELYKVATAREALENELGEKVSAIRQKYRAKDLREELDHIAQRRKAREKDAADQEKRRERISDLWRSSNPERALKYSESTQSINEQIKAIQYLKQARDKLTVSQAGGEEEYKKKIEELNKKIDERGKKVDELRGKQEQLGKSKRSLMNTADQLQRKLALLFSVSAIQGYINKLVQVRGEFEIQQRSLEILLQNKKEADKLWDQTIKLAVKSPFTVKQLVTYTKQLAAYRIESDKLYETNKMLADVSAGLGVDMQRLILAFGQVKAANFLRGTELRQFSEAGVNMLNELAKKFTEVEGRTVSVGEVFDRVSKRMVSFKDVEEVFKNITSKGGIFYQMQEKQAETLAGQMANLRDSYDLMLNEIGKDNEGITKGFIQGLRNLIKEWQLVAPAIAAAVKIYATFLSLKGLTKLISGVKLLHESLVNVATGAKSASTALSKIGGTGGGILMIVSIIISLGVAIYDTLNAADEFQREFNAIDRETLKNEQEAISNFIELANVLKNAKEGSEEFNAAMDDLKRIFKDMLPNEMLKIENIRKMEQGYKDAAAAIRLYYSIEASEKKKASAAKTLDENIKEDYDDFIKHFKDSIEGGIDENVLSQSLADDIRAGYIGALNKTIDSAKNGEIEATEESLTNEFFKNLSNFTGANEEELKNALRIVSSYYKEQLDDIADDIETYRQKIGDIDIQARPGETREIQKQRLEYEKQAKVLGELGTKYSDLKAKIAAYYEILQKERKGEKVDSPTKFNLEKEIADSYRNLQVEVPIKPSFVMKEGAAFDFSKLFTDQTAVDNEISRIGAVIYTSFKNQIIPPVNEASDSILILNNNAQALEQTTPSIWDFSSAMGGLEESSTNIEQLDFTKPFDFLSQYIDDADSASTATGQLGEDVDKLLNGFNLDTIQRFTRGVIESVAEASGLSLDLFDNIQMQSGAALTDFHGKVKSAMEAVEARYLETKQILENNPINSTVVTYYVQSQGLESVDQLKKRMEEDRKLIQSYQQMLKRTGWVDPKAKKNKPKKAKKDKKTTTKKTDDPAEALADYLDEAYDRFLEFNEEMSETAANNKIFEIYGKEFETLEEKVKGLDLKLPLFKQGDEKPYLDALDKIKEKARTETKKQITDDARDAQADTFLEKKKEENEATKEQVDLLFEEYEIYKELEKIGMSPAMAKGLFGISTTSLNDITQKLQELKNAGKFEGTNMTEAYEEYSKKIKDEETKQQQDRLKIYTEYAKKSVGERAKIELEYLNHMAEIEKATIGRGTDADKDGHLQSVYDNATAKAMEERNDALQKFEWEEFQKSDLFLMMFEDLDSANEKLIRNSLDKIKRYKEEWADMPLEDVRAMTEKINQLESALLKLKSPWNAIKDIDKTISETLGGKTREEVNAEAIDAQAKIDQNNIEIGQLKTIRTLLAEGKYISSEQRAIYQQLTGDTNANLETINAEIDARKDANKELNKPIETDKKLTEAEKDKINAYQQQAEAYDKINSEAQKLYDASKELIELFAGDDSIGMMFADMGMSIADSVLSTLSLQANLAAAQVSAQGFGAALNSAMGIIGWIVMGVQVISQVLGAIFGAKDKKLQKEIDKLDEDIEKLSKALEKLEDALEKNYAFASLRSDMQEINSNIDKQIAKRRRQIELEKDKKKTDKDQIKDLEDEIEELQEKRAELRKEMIESLGGVDDYRSATREFVDAWVDAFNETGNGLQGLTDNFREFFKNIILEQAVMKGAGKIMEPLLNEINMSLDDYEIQGHEEQKIKALSEQKMKELDEFLNGLFGENGMWNEWIDDKGQSLSGLQEGIQGVTEETAQIIEAYLNSIRFYIAQDNQNLADLRNFFIGSEEDTNPILSQLKMQTELIRAIKDMFSSVIYSGGHPTYGGAFLKVSL